MKTVFFCNSCGVRFEVEARLAGKTARCKKCGQKIVIPKPAELASMALPAAAPAAPEAAPRLAPAAPRLTPAAPAVAARRATWVEAVTSQVGLAPITDEGPATARMPAPKPTPLDDEEDSKPYTVIATRSRRRRPCIRASGRPRTESGGGASCSPSRRSCDG